VRARKGYHFIDSDQNETIFLGLTMVKQFLNTVSNTHEYIIQQPVPMIFKERRVDFRVIMQKDHSGKWQCTEILGKFGAKRSVTSNFVENVFLRRGRETLQEVFLLDKESALQKENENLNIWILEINSNHAKNYPLYIKNNRKMYRYIYTKPLTYAKFLAGF